MGSSVCGMPHLFQLARQGTTPNDGMAAIYLMNGEIHRSARQTIPFDYRIVIGLGRIQQVAVLDKKQGPYHQRRDGVKVRVLLPRVAEVEQDLILTIQDFKTRGDFLVVDGVDASSRKPR